MSSFYQNRLPGHSIDATHLLDSVSHTALTRADGWKAGAEEIDRVSGKVEALLAV